MLHEPLLIAVLSAHSIALLAVAKGFGIKKRNVIVFLIPITIFTLGYSLRLSGAEDAIDPGFYLTDSSFLFVYILFSFFMMLGQLRY